MTNDFVTKIDDAYRIAGTRISLDSIVIDFLNGLSPQAIADNFQELSIEQINGATAFYLQNRAEIDAYIEQGRLEFEAQRQKAREQNPLLYKKLEEAARDTHIKQ
ncbi:MAG TPA: DUF433 domain-containing protein [Blastocatellia bacterium]|nr:DUF433 domain-containing protein [Blastocatellia bacterium]